MNFAWRDEIPGKIVHDMTGVKNKYGPESFVCAVEVKGILTLGIEVEKEDFLYWFLYNFSKSLQSLLILGNLINLCLFMMKVLSFFIIL